MACSLKLEACSLHILRLDNYKPPCLIRIASKQYYIYHFAFIIKSVLLDFPQTTFFLAVT